MYVFISSQQKLKSYNICTDPSLHWYCINNLELIDVSNAMKPTSSHILISTIQRHLQKNNTERTTNLY